MAHDLKIVGIEVTSLMDVEDVIPTLLRSLKAGKPYDLGLFDIQMPHTDGYDLARRVRDPKYKFSNLTLVAISSSMERDLKKCQAAGFDGFLSKPIQRDKLYRMLERLIGKQEDRKNKLKS